jgi:hypothetical protein
MAGVPVKRRESKYIRRSPELGERFWRSAAKYFLLGKDAGTGRCYIYLANAGVYNMVDPTNAQLSGREENITREDTEGCLDCPNTNAQTLHWTEDPQVSAMFERVDFGSSGSIQSENKCSCNSNEEHEKTCTVELLQVMMTYERKILKFLFDHIVTPAEACLKLRKFMTTIRVSEEDKIFKDVIQVYNRWVRSLTLIEFVDMYRDKVKVYGAVDASFKDTYWDEEESLKKLEYFLDLQFHNPEQSYEFMVNLYKSQTRQGGKKGNALWIKGPPDCGKSWFVDSLKSLQGTYGICSILNKNNNFATAGLVDKRLIVLDEFSFDPLVYSDVVKPMLSGNAFATPQKYKSDGCVLKTPVILISNGECLPDNEVFNARHTRVNWETVRTHSYTPLEQVSTSDPEKIVVNGVKMKLVHNFFGKLLHPMAFVNYWEKWKIWNTKYAESVYVIDYED